MKSFILSLFTSIVIASAICSCNNKAESSKITFDSIVVDTIVNLTNAVNSPKCTIKMNIKIAKGKNAEKINDSILRNSVLAPDYSPLSDEKLTPKQMIDSFVKNYIGEYKTFYSHIYKESKATNEANLSYSIQTNIKEGKSGILIYIIHTTDAHGSEVNEFTTAKNIDSNKGKILTLNDVFVPGYEQGINDIIKKELADKYHAKDSNELKGQGFFTNENIYATANFMLEDDNLTFIYITGEIADRTKGEISISIPYSDIKDLLK